ncbi:MAG: hypothetical protein H6Q55_3230, partial [Deltaproteobacteria bacterium]|nr:hypothetical protein [Deltaproteobacteria bacterium]
MRANCPDKTPIRPQLLPLVDRALSGLKTSSPVFPQNVFPDEKSKLRAGQWACLHIITGSGLGELRVPQNPGVG